MDYMIAMLQTVSNLFSLPPALLVALCSAESDFRSVVNPQDGGSPSIGVCQIKESTARLVGFSGHPALLMKPEVNARFAAKYLKKQLDRYQGNACKAIAAYNAGRLKLNEQGKVRNSKYLKRVLSRWNKYSYGPVPACGGVL